MTRVVALIGASGTGKSTLVDRMCAIEGEPCPPAGAGELRVASFPHLSDRWQAIDTPGSVEFLHLASDALLAADAAVICVSPDPAEAVLAAPFLRLVEAAGTPAILFVNRMDEAEARLRDIVAALQDYASHPVVLRQVPIRESDGHVSGSVDLVSERAWRYNEGAPSDLVEIPPGMIDREHEARDDLLERLSEFDDHLLEELIEDKIPPTEEVHGICARLLAETRIIPALIGSAGHGNGVVRLMKALRHEAPSPEILRRRLAEQTGTDPAAIVFAGQYRKHLGKTLLLRVLAPLSGPLGGKAPGHLSAADHRDNKPLQTASEGEIVAAAKSDHLLPGRLATAAALHPTPDWNRPLPPLQHRVLRPAAERDSAKLSAALATLAEGDGALTVAPDPATGFPRIGVQGPLHLRLLKQRLADSFGIEVEESPPAPDYRETIAKTVDQAYRHKKQTGGAGQFADVRLTVGPATRGAGFVFSDTVKGGAVPKNYIPAVEAGALEATERGPLGFPVVDIAVTLTDGLHHAVDSSDMAFRIAGKRAVGVALKAAGPVLLQPVFRLRIEAPSVYTGALGPIVSSHHGQVLGFDGDPQGRGWDVFEAMVPGAALDGIGNDIRAATQGVGRFAASFDHFDELHGKAADRIVQDRMAEPV